MNRVHVACTYFLSIFNPQQSGVTFYIKVIANWPIQRAIYLRNRNSGIMFQSFGKGIPDRSKFLHKRKHIQIQCMHFFFIKDIVLCLL
jgi:hypothetical protein